MVKKHSLSLFGHRTSISLEEEFWAALTHIAETKNLSLQALIESIDTSRKGKNLSSTLRVYVLDFYKSGLMK